MALVVHTAALEYEGPDKLDIRTGTSAAGGAALGPSAETAAALLALASRERLSDQEWLTASERYVVELRATWRRDRSVFSSLLERAEVTLVCDCRDGARCHRRVLAEVLVKLGAEYRGERTAIVSVAVVSIDRASERPRISAAKQNWKDQDWVVVDCETTGLDTEVDRIIEIAFCRVEGRRIAERASWLVDPELASLPAIITEITGLRIEDLRGQPRFSQIAGFVAQRMASASVLAAYNVPFDRAFIAAELNRSRRTLEGQTQPRSNAGLSVDHRSSGDLALQSTWAPSAAWPSWIDPMVFIKQFDRYEKGKKLTDAAGRRNIVVEGQAHRALADAEMAARVLVALLPELPDDFASVIELQERWRVEQEVDFQAWRARQPR